MASRVLDFNLYLGPDDVWSAELVPICPYCESDNAAIRETYFDQTCAGCVRRMFRAGYCPPKRNEP